MAVMLINDEALNVLVEGEEGAPVVMLAHSLGTNLHVFDPIMPELLQRFRVVRYDARGHGSSVVTAGPYSISELAQDALNIAEALGLEQVRWLGLSMGSMVGLWIMTHAPSHIGQAVLANVAAQFGSADMWNERIRVAHEEGLNALAPSILENWFTKSFREHHTEEVERVWEMLLSTPAEGYAGVCAALRDMDQREAIGTIKQPVLVIVGRHDPITTPGLGALVASAISGAKLVTIEAAHISCVENPEAFSQATIEFLTAEAPMLTEEEIEHEVTPEVVPEAPPPKKPRKPRAPRPPKAESQIDVAPTASAVIEETEEPEPLMNGEALHDAEEVPAAPAPAPVVGKPRAPRKPKAAAPAPEAAEPAPAPVAPIAVAAPQPRKRPAKKAAARKAPARKASARKAAPARKASAARQAPARKVVAKKAPAKKAAVKKAAAKKSPARKVVGKKVAAKKSALRKVRAAAPARKAVAKKTVAKKSAVKKSAVKKSAAKKPIRKIAAKKAAVRKAVVKKTLGQEGREKDRREEDHGAQAPAAASARPADPQALRLFERQTRNAGPSGPAFFVARSRRRSSASAAGRRRRREWRRDRRSR